MRKRVLVMPQFNEARTVIQVLEEATAYVDYIVVVDDCSTDASRGLIEAWMEGKDKVYLVHLGKNRGMSGALLAGFCHVYKLLEDGTVRGDDIVINIDADGQHRPQEIPSAIDFLEQHGYDVVLTRRDLSGYPWLKRVGNRGLSLWATWLGGVKYHDVECGFRFMRAAVIPRLLQYFTGRRYGCAQEIGIITALLGFKINNQLPTHINYYRKGARVRDGLTNLSMGLVAFLRVKLGIRNRVSRLLERVFNDATVLPAAPHPGLPLLDVKEGSYGERVSHRRAAAKDPGGSTFPG